MSESDGKVTKFSLYCEGVTASIDVSMSADEADRLISDVTARTDDLTSYVLTGNESPKLFLRPSTVITFIVQGKPTTQPKKPNPPMTSYNTW